MSRIATSDITAGSEKSDFAQTRHINGARKGHPLLIMFKGFPMIRDKYATRIVTKNGSFCPTVWKSRKVDPLSRKALAQWRLVCPIIIEDGSFGQKNGWAKTCLDPVFLPNHVFARLQIECHWAPAAGLFNRQTKEPDPNRTIKPVMVPKFAPAENGCDLSINRYKEFVHEEEQYDSPKVILGRLNELEAEIAADLEELEAMLG